MQFISRFCLYFCLIIAITATFTPHFESFLKEKYDTDFERLMTRADMGSGFVGSFGGKEADTDVVVNQPVIFVHGVTLRAGIFIPHRAHFITNGYTSAELYATTYADGGQTPMFLKDMRCEDVFHIRNFIESVIKYTNSTVDVIAYSMGVAIARKAILGGHCVDTDKYIGKPITESIDTFVAVAGVSHGLENCPEYYPACNIINGMSCSSEFLKNVNQQTHRFEARTTYSIYSTSDNVVGQNCCGYQCSHLNHATNATVFKFFDHGSILTLTKIIQLSMVKNHDTCAKCPLDGPIDRSFFE